MPTLNDYSLALILTEGTFSCVKASSTLGFVSHDSLTRQLAKVWGYTSVVDWDKLPKHGTLVVDDTVIAKPYSKAIEHVTWTYSSSDKKVLPGISCLLALWIVDGTTYILSVSLPGNENRNDLFRRLLQELTLKGFEAETVFFDAWYAASETLNLLHALGWTYVSRIKSNRTFNKQALEKLSFHGAQGQYGKLKGVSHQVQIVKHHERYLVTNNLIPHTSQTLGRLYQERWVIETVFRALKHVLHLEKCSCRNSDAQLSHILCALEAYIYLQRTFPTLSPEAAQQQMLHQYRCHNCKPSLTQRRSA
jgi:putative transposase